MLEEEGVVVGVDGGIARVRIEPKGTCESCASSGSCKMTPDPTGVLEAVNTPGARIGQRVRVTMKPGVVLKASFFLYGIPLTDAVIFAIVAKILAVKMELPGDPDLWAFGAGLLGLTTTYLVMKLVYRLIEENPDFKPRIVEIIG